MRCIICKNEIEYLGVGRPQLYCEHCRPIQRKQYQQQYNKQYKKHRPKSAITGNEQYYQLYKFFETLTDQELQVLFLKRKHDCKYKPEQILQLRTEMTIITQILENRQHTLE